MKLFRPYARPEDAKNQSVEMTTEAQSSGSETTSTSNDAATKSSRAKAGPTRSRRKAEADRRERLRPTLTKKERRAQERKAAVAKRNRDLAESEKSPERVLLRNLIDSKWTLSELALPLMLILFALVMVFQRNQQIATFLTILAYVLMASVVLEMIMTWRRFVKLLAQRYPSKRTRGLKWYMIGRMVQIRRFRVPPPAVKRGSAI